MNNTNTLRDVLRNQVDAFASIGHPHVIMRLVTERGIEPETVVKAAKLGEKKNCFANAAKQSLLTEGAETYVEGYAMNLDIGLPFHHAWTKRADGVHVEHTLRGDISRYVYLGVEFAHDVLCRELADNKVFGLLDLGHTINLRLIGEIDPATMQWAKRVREARPLVPGTPFCL